MLTLKGYVGHSFVNEESFLAGKSKCHDLPTSKHWGKMKSHVLILELSLSFNGSFNVSVVL